MKFYISFLAVAILGLGSSAGAISRSGGGKLESFELGFVAEVPREYARVNPIQDNGVRLWSDTVFGSTPFSPEQFIEVRTIETEFPELATSSRGDVEAEFARLGWAKSGSANHCVDVYRNTSASVSSLVVMWGSRRGIVILGGLSRPAQLAIDEIVITLKLLPGSCGW